MNDDPVDHDLKRLIPAEGSADRRAGAHLLRVRLAGDAGARRRRLVTWGLLAVAAVVVAVAAGIAFVPRSPVSTGPGDVASPMSCGTSPVTQYESAWKEIGGPGGFFLFFSGDPEPFYATPFAWLITTRVSPRPSTGQRVELWGDRLGSSDLEAGSLGTDPRNAPASPPPVLPGRQYLFQQRFPLPGCWRLSTAIDGEVVGTAVVNVRVGTASALPIGSFMTSVPIPDGPCIAFRSVSRRYGEAAAVEAWRWEMGRSGDCTTSASTRSTSEATIVPRSDAGYDLVVDLARRGGPAEKTRITLYVLAAPEAVERLIEAQGDLTPLGGIVLSPGYPSVFFVPQD